jgi:hypothetical protein
MANEKIIVAVGTSDETTAHLRLLMRQAAPKLNHKWVWGPEVSADLVVVDPDAFAGQMARTRAQSSGVRCAVVADADGEPPTDALWLRKPLRLENVIDVMNEAGRASIKTVDVEAHGADFYFKDLDEFKPDRNDAPVDPWAEKRRSTLTQQQEHMALGVDELIKGDPLADTGPKKPLPTLGDDVTIEATEGPTRRSETKADARISMLQGATTGDAGMIGLGTAAKAKPPGDTDKAPLEEYLSGNLLGGPSSLKVDEAPALVLDPKHEQFHADASLSALEPYCRDAIARNAWRRQTSAELAHTPASVPGRPYAHLRWLTALLHSNGRLSPKLDPGGTYRLKERIDVEPEFRDHGAIADAMNEPARLNEITAASKSSMERVFDVVNAYDAIGALEWQPRARLRGEDPAQKPKSGSLFDKLKSVFGKS